MNAEVREKYTRERSAVVHVIGATLAGGAERFVASLLQELKSGGLDVHLVALSSRSDAAGNAMRQMLGESGITCHIGPTARIGGRTVLWYRRHVKGLLPRIVHLHTPNTELVHFLSQRFGDIGGALFRTLHCEWVPLPGSARALQWLTEIALRRNVAVRSLACSEAVAASNRPFVSGEIWTVLNGVRFDFPLQDEAQAQAHKRQLGWDIRVYHFIQVGNMAGDSLAAALKAHDIVLAAWKHGGFGSIGCVLHLLGDGNLRAKLQNLAGADSSVQFHGIRDDVASYLLASDCFLMPSRSEGMPIAAIEALGAGLPCIFTDIAPLRELRPPVAEWVPVDSVVEMANAMRRFQLQRPAPAKLEVGKFRESFSIGRTSEMYARMYFDAGADRSRA